MKTTKTMILPEWTCTLWNRRVHVRWSIDAVLSSRVRAVVSVYVLAAGLVTGPLDGGGNPSIRSYTHLAEAGCGRPTRPQQPTPQRKALTKGKRLPVKAVTSLDNGRKWRVYAGRTLELLR